MPAFVNVLYPTGYWLNTFEGVLEIDIFTPESGLLEAVAATVGAVLYP